jgi:hypothetical protein
MIEINYIAKELLLHHDTTCCSEQKDKHFEFQCRFHEECVIASYHTGDYAHLGMEQVEEFVTFLACVELQSFIDENRTCPIANRFEREITFILEYCKMNFSQNIYVVDYNEKLRGKLAQKSTDVLQVEEDKDLSLGMPVQPQEIENDKQPENKDVILLMKLVTLMIDFAFMILMMRRNINLCLMRTILITILKMMRSMV